MSAPNLLRGHGKGIASIKSELFPFAAPPIIRTVLPADAMRRAQARSRTPGLHRFASEKIHVVKRPVGNAHIQGSLVDTGRGAKCGSRTGWEPYA
jgi:hypothetical protein